jgi:hypothetical protein
MPKKLDKLPVSPTRADSDFTVFDTNKEPFEQVKKLKQGLKILECRARQYLPILEELLS